MADQTPVDVKSIVLLSGGLDSAVCLYDEIRAGHEVYALTVLYGQRHAIEVVAARRVATTAGVVQHVTTEVGFDHIDGRLLDDADGQVWPRTLEEMNRDRISPMYVPARNTVLLALALSWADSISAARVVVGANADDSKFPDCRSEFIDAMRHVAAYGTRNHPLVIAPLLSLTKAEVVSRALDLGVPTGITVSCYSPSKNFAGVVEHCGVCDACVIRRNAFGSREDGASYIRSDLTKVKFARPVST